MCPIQVTRVRQLDLRLASWGGRRPGAGRPPATGRRTVAHRRRAAHEARCPVHVTLRARAGLPSLRGAKTFAAVRDALGQASRAGFRVIHFSVQADHVHLLVEADGVPAWRRGIQGLMIRIAKRLNRTLRRRGAIWADRYYARRLATPREVRHALVYVLQNWRKHVAGSRGIDPCSSGMEFDGWRAAVRGSEEPSPPVARARSWLARIGWRRHGLIGVEERPRR